MKILVGKTKDNFVEFELGINEYLSLSGTEYDKNLFTDKDGEKRAKDMLEDGESWKIAVENERTTLSKEEWNEKVLNIDGWESVLGDVKYIEKLNKYTTIVGSGQIDMHLKLKDFVEFYIPKEDVKYIFWIWARYHLKQLDKIPKNVLEKIKSIFEKNKSDIQDVKGET